MGDGNDFEGMRVDTEIKTQSLLPNKFCFYLLYYTLYAYTYFHDAFEHSTKKEFEQFLHFSFFEKYLKTFFFLFFCKLATYIKNTANIGQTHDKNE